MLDFPNTPVEGDVHVENGQSWTYRNGVWAVGNGDGAVTEIAETSGQHLVVGDILIQWGTYGTDATGAGVINYPFAYKELPVVITDAYWGVANTNTTFNTVGETLTSTEVRAVDNSTGAALQFITNGRWIAIGKAPDDMAKPTEVLGGAGTPSPVQIVDDGSGYTIIGNKLIQWGNGAISGSGNPGATIAFPIAYKSGTVPTVTTSSADISSSNGPRVPVGISTSETGFTARGVGSAGNTYNLVFHWIAVGEAPSDRVMPTEVQVVGSPVTEFHDPTDAYSWRIIGNTLELWGVAQFNNPGGTQLNFPKSFEGGYAFTAMANISPQSAVVNNGAGTGSGILVWMNKTVDGSLAADGHFFSWRAIGKWDGVS